MRSDVFVSKFVQNWGFRYGVASFNRDQLRVDAKTPVDPRNPSGPQLPDGVQKLCELSNAQKRTTQSSPCAHHPNPRPPNPGPPALAPAVALRPLPDLQIHLSPVHFHHPARPLISACCRSMWLPLPCATPDPDQDWGTISVWAWGAAVVTDFLLEDPVISPWVDPTRLMSMGHSRGGKTALWHAAQDTRVSAVFPLMSGMGGNGPLRVRQVSAIFPLFWPL